MEEWETGNAESDTGGEEGGCGDDVEVIYDSWWSFD